MTKTVKFFQAPFKPSYCSLYFLPFPSTVRLSLFPDEFNSITPRLHRSHYSQASGEHSNKQMKMTLSQPVHTDTHTNTHNLEKDYTRDEYKIKTFHLIISGKINHSPQTRTHLTSEQEK